MSPLLLYTVLQFLSSSQGLNFTNDHFKNVREPAHHSAIDLSTLSLSKGCFGVLRALDTNIQLDVTLNLLEPQEQKDLADQICENLGCGQAHAMKAMFDDCLAGCVLKDSKLHNCTPAAGENCTDAIEVICEHQVVRLAEGLDPCAGRVELLYNRRWGTVCDDDFDNGSGHVVCAQLGCGNMVKLGNFGAGTGPIHISKMKCNGEERNLWECVVNDTTSTDYCGHKEDVGIVCSESMELTPITSDTTYMMTWTTESSTVAVMKHNSVDSPAVIGCFILSVALLFFILSNAALCFHLKRNAFQIQQHHGDSTAGREYQNSALINIYNPSVTTAPEACQYESLTSRQGSNYGHNFVGISGVSAHSSLFDSDCEPPNSNGAQLYVNPPVNRNDSSSTSSGESYHNLNIHMDTILKSDGNEVPSQIDTSLLTPLAFGDAKLPATFTQAVDLNDSSSTSSGEFYENTKTDVDIDFKTNEEDSHQETSPLSMSYNNQDLQDKKVNDSDSISSGEDYQNTEKDNDLQSDEESPSLPEQSLQTPHNSQMTGNTIVYSGIRQQGHGTDSDSTSSEECYLNVDFHEDDVPQSGKESPSPHETSLQNPLNHDSAQMTGSAVGYQDHHIPTNLSQEKDNTSTSSENSYVNFPPRNESDDECSPEREQGSSSENDFDEPENW